MSTKNDSFNRRDFFRLTGAVAVGGALVGLGPKALTAAGLVRA